MELSLQVVETLKKYGVGRRSSDDPFFEDQPPPRLGVYDLDDENLCHQFIPVPCTVPGCCFTAATVQEHASHYDLAHRYTCATCRKMLPSPHLLDLHVQERHDSFFAVAAERKPSYCCYTEECKEKFWNAEERFQHCVRTHKLPKDFRLEHAASKNRKSRSKKKSEGMEISEMSGNSEETTSNSEENCSNNVSSGPKVMKNFSFGHNKSKGFYKPSFRKFTNSECEERHVDMDVIVSDLKDSLPE